MTTPRSFASGMLILHSASRAHPRTEYGDQYGVLATDQTAEPRLGLSQEQEMPPRRLDSDRALLLVAAIATAASK
jgi:hypothetical protein